MDKNLIITAAILFILMYVVPFFRELPFNIKEKHKAKKGDNYEI